MEDKEEGTLCTKQMADTQKSLIKDISKTCVQQKIA